MGRDTLEKMFLETAKCNHEWKWHSKDGDYHDMYQCKKCLTMQCRKIK